MSLSEWIPVLAAVAGGGAVSAVAAVFSYRLNRRMAEKQTELLNLQIKNVESKVDYELSSMQESILYDGTKGMDGFHFELHGTSAVDQGARAEGKHNFLEGRILNVERTNREGRYEVKLIQYEHGGMRQPFVPKNLAIAGPRHIKVQYLAKAIGARHHLRGVLKSTGKDGPWIAKEQGRYIDEGGPWEPVEWFFHANPSLDFWVRLDDLDVSAVPSSVQIKDLRVIEKTA